MSDEHPIIFNEWSIRRILAGEKTQTRRVATEDSTCNRIEWTEDVATIRGEEGSTYTGWTKRYPEDEGPPFGISIKCPYGQPGDVLWVREGFRLAQRLNDTPPKEAAIGDGMVEPPVPQVRYEADGRIITEANEWGRKRPSIHMPRELCRLRLRVEDVRVQRVQEISHEDVSAEGVDLEWVPEIGSRPETARRALRDEFARLWNSIHGDDAWERNQWVWIVEFSRINE